MPTIDQTLKDLQAALDNLKADPPPDPGSNATLTPAQQKLFFDFLDKTLEIKAATGLKHPP